MFRETFALSISTIHLLLLTVGTVAILHSVSIAKEREPSELATDSSLYLLSVKYSSHNFGVAGIATNPSSDWFVLRSIIENTAVAKKLKWNASQLEEVKTIAGNGIAQWLNDASANLAKDIGILDPAVRRELLGVIGADGIDELDFLALMLDGFVVIRRQGFVARLHLQKPQLETIDSLIDDCWRSSVAPYAQNRFAEVTMSVDLERVWASHLTKASIRLNLQILEVLSEDQRDTLFRDLKDRSSLYEVARLIQNRAFDGTSE